MKNKKKITSNQAKANAITYMFQDFLDNVSNGCQFKFNSFQKEILIILNDKAKNWQQE